MTGKILIRCVLLAGCAVMVSCAGAPKGATPAASPGVETEEIVGGKKLWTGSVRFMGFPESGLDEMRVIPEEKSVVYRPRNAEYHGVDGFWWKGDRTHWFKIPGHCQVVVWPAGYAGERPKVEGDGEEVNVTGGRPQAWTRCKPWLTRVLVSQGRVYKAGWYPDAGKSSIGVDWPF